MARSSRKPRWPASQIQFGTPGYSLSAAVSPKSPRSRRTLLAQNGSREPWRIPTMLPWDWQPPPIDTTVEPPLPDERKQCEPTVLAGFDGIRRIAPPSIAIPKDHYHRNAGNRGIMPECGWSWHVPAARGCFLYQSWESRSWGGGGVGTPPLAQPSLDSDSICCTLVGSRSHFK